MDFFRCMLAAGLTAALVACTADDAKNIEGGAMGGAAGGGAGTGGSVAAGGTAGNGGSVNPAKAQKIDLLLMIDNSASMADKQQILASAVPDLVGRLVNPACIDSQGQPVANQPSKPLDECPAGSKREFTPVFDIHVGVITSSIGGHGADVCNESGPTGYYNPRMADMSHLITRGDAANPDVTVPTWQNKGFLFWDPTQAGSPPGDMDINSFVDKFNKIVVGAGQDGCGFEAPLEAWYRFLVEPKPYVKMVPYDCATNIPSPNGDCRGPEGVDQVVLSQRKDFLRPDSLVAVVMLTDEDDCSIRDGWQNYIVAQVYAGSSPWHMPRATSECKTNPGSPACMSCLQGDHTSDPECQKGNYGDMEDSINLRCFREKQRFGVDFLYSTKRYVDALTKTTLEDGSVNPLFCSAPSADGKSCTTAMRPTSLALLAGIVGVPWQDLARDPQDLSKGYKPATELAWDNIAGDLANYVDPKDPLMVPSIEPRTGVNPATGQPLAPPTATTPTANSINGHEWYVPYRNDLQYACVFKLPTPKDCSNNAASCDCADADAANNPLCQSDTGQYGKLQYRAKAYPGVRLLTVLKGVGAQAAVASICAANADDPQSPIFGYRPAISAIVERMRPSL